MEKNKVSIIIPTFNYGHLIAETLNCLLHQSYQNWQAIIIDDGSTDDTKDIVEPFILNDNRFYYLQQQNKGVSASRNNGLKLAEGEFIQFLDADDLISQEKISLQVAYLNTHPEIAVCTSRTFFFETGNNNKLFNDFSLKNKTTSTYVNGFGFDLIADLIPRNLLSIQNPLFRKNILKEIAPFKEGMHYLEDWDFWFRIAAANFQFGFLNSDLAYGLVRVHNSSATQQSIKIIDAEFLLRALIESNINKTALSEQQKEKLLNQNRKERFNTYKKLMAKTHLLNIKKFKQYYKEINNLSVFFKIFFKSLNIRRKSLFFV